MFQEYTGRRVSGVDISRQCPLKYPSPLTHALLGEGAQDEERAHERLGHVVHGVLAGVVPQYAELRVERVERRDAAGPGPGDLVRRVGVELREGVTGRKDSRRVAACAGVAPGRV